MTLDQLAKLKTHLAAQRATLADLSRQYAQAKIDVESALSALRRATEEWLASEEEPQAPEEPSTPPAWRYVVGPPASAYHLYALADSAEAECGETTDDETRACDGLPPPEQTCLDCREIAVARGLRAPAEAAEEEAPAADEEAKSADVWVPPAPAFETPKASCMAFDCDKPGTESGAGQRGARFCSLHAAQDLSVRREWAAAAKRSAA